MFCKKCGKAIPDDSQFCPYCGTDNLTVPVETASELPSSVQENKQEPIAPTPEKHKKSAAKGFWIGLLAFVLVALLAYTVPYLIAKKAAIDGNYEKAKSLLKVPAITEMHDKYLFEYIDAGQLVEQEKYGAAYKAFDKLASIGYEDSKEKLEDLKETIYKKAVFLYRNRDDKYSWKERINTDGYYALLNLIPEYKDAGKYLLLAKAVVSGVSDREYDKLVADLSFEDTKEVLLSNIIIAKKYLLGSWKTDDGKWNFQMQESTASCNLPKPNVPDATVYSIDNGIYFCYADGNTYTMHRQ